MPLESEIRERIESLIQSNDVVLFMKGTRQMPQCGFSATTVQVLDSLVSDYETVDVLSDPAVRQGIKEFSSWPTIPQLYVRGEFVGGCDIVRELYETRELHEKLGVEAPDPARPNVTVTPQAAEAIRQASANAPEPHLHLRIDASFEHSLYLGPVEAGDVEVETNGVQLYLDPASAQRAEGAAIDVAQSEEGPAFKIHNPNAPGAGGQAGPGADVHELEPAELKRWMDEGADLLLVDVRTPEERGAARIEGSRLLDEDLVRELQPADPDTVLVFHCHHGGRGRAAAEQFGKLGFRRLYNLRGGIDAWSQEVDPNVPRY